MKSFFKLASKLSLVFFTSFVLAFTSSSVSLADLMNVELDWSNLPEAISLANDKAVSTTKTVTKTLGQPYVNTLIKISNNIAFADSQPKTEIYSAPDKVMNLDLFFEKLDSFKALTANEIIANRSSFGVLINPDANIPYFVYYSQHDPRWKDYLIGGKDPVETYGCGPTALSMLVSNLSKSGFTPDQAADWCLKNGYYRPGSGSYHNIIVKGANAFGIDTVPYKNYTKTAIAAELKKGNVFAVLTKPGVFSKASNHFILITGLDKNGQAIVAEPNSPERAQKSWDLDFLIKQFQYSAGGGGPLWKVNLAKQ